MASPLIVFLGWTLLATDAVCSGASIIKGVSYGPLPLKSKAGQVAEDDWFCDEAVPMWGSAGRGDLAVMKQLGANMVRLYGNNPNDNHANFLDEAHAQGLSVAPGMSDYPYFQKGPENCLTSGFNCFSHVKLLYLKNLRNGFLNMTNSYHPALKYMNIMNEPDLKMPPNADVGGVDAVYKMCRTIISAFDGMLDAEREAGVTGPLINFTATVSFAMCRSCEFSRGRPALAQIAQLDDAMRYPEKYGYTPKNNITSAYHTRFTHSFNTANPAVDVKNLFLDEYEKKFPLTPVYIGEYHRVGTNQTEDLHLILQMAEASPNFLGISFFQYQVAYWKGGSEMAFGMFGLGDYVLASMPYFSQTYNIYCLQPEFRPETGRLPDAVTSVYGGSGVDYSTLCVANPLGVALDQAGFAQIASQLSTHRMMLLVQRVIHHMGGFVGVENRAKLERFAGQFARPNGQGFAQVASAIGSRPDWVEFDPDAKCVADRSMHPSVIGSAIGWVCSQESMDCSDIPQHCKSSTYRKGDYFFSRYMKTHGDTRNPLVSCSFGGAAMYAPFAIYSNWVGAEYCVVDGTTTTLTSTTTSTSTITTITTTRTTITSTGTGTTFMATTTTTTGATTSTVAVMTTSTEEANTSQGTTRHMDVPSNHKDFSGAGGINMPLHAGFAVVVLLFLA